jgi:hypothetical protein
VGSLSYVQLEVVLAPNPTDHNEATLGGTDTCLLYITIAGSTVDAQQPAWLMWNKAVALLTAALAMLLLLCATY